MRSIALGLLSFAALTAFAPPPAQKVAPPPVVRIAPPPATLTISPDGKSVLLEGSLERGTAAKFKAVLDAAPNLQTVVLQSKGGRLGEAIDIGAAIRAKGLNTYVETWCHSACTIILLAGRDRAASPSARIGFHEPVFPGAKPADIPTLRSVARRIYDDAGVRPTFTDRTFATPAAGMWFPSSEELRAAQVLTRISLSGETRTTASKLRSRADITAALATIPFWTNLQTRFPEIANAIVDEAWRAKEAGLNDNDIASAGRAVLIKNTPTILASASDALLAEYLDLIIDQASAARALSFEACDKAFNGQLNIAATLPPALIERETALMSKVLSSSYPDTRRPVASVDSLIEPILRRLPADQIEAMDASNSDYSKAARCDGMIAFLREIRRLPNAPRAMITRAMFLEE